MPLFALPHRYHYKTRKLISESDTSHFTLGLGTDVALFDLGHPQDTPASSVNRMEDLFACKSNDCKATSLTVLMNRILPERTEVSAILRLSVCCTKIPPEQSHARGENGSCCRLDPGALSRETYGPCPGGKNRKGVVADASNVSLGSVTSNRCSHSVLGL